MGTPRLSIVYADDDDLVREVVVDVLIDAGVDVHACADGEEAIALCTTLRPRVVLLDLNMPEPDGLETARRLRRIPGMADARLIALTGRGTWDLRKKAFDAGFDEFLVKPIGQEVLLRALSGSSSNESS
jgi:CheY-like chemotaxis protein